MELKRVHYITNPNFMHYEIRDIPKMGGHFMTPVNKCQVLRKSHQVSPFLTYCWWKKSCTTCYLSNPTKNGIFSISTRKQLREKNRLNRFEPQKKTLTFQYTGCLIGILTMAYYNHGSFDDLSPSHGVSPSLKFRHQWSHAPPDWGVLQSETPRVWMWHFWKHRKASQKKTHLCKTNRIRNNALFFCWVHMSFQLTCFGIQQHAHLLKMFPFYNLYNM